MEIETTPEAPTGQRDALPNAARRAAGAAVDVTTEALGKALAAFLSEMGEVLEVAPSTVGPYDIESIEISVGMSHTGSLRIVTSSANAALKVNLKRGITATVEQHD